MYSFQFLAYYSVFCLFVLWSRGLVCVGGYAGLSQGWLWEYHVMLVAYCGLLDVYQGGLEPASGAGAW
jgi:hypothetical protein